MKIVQSDGYYMDSKVNNGWNTITHVTYERHHMWDLKEILMMFHNIHMLIHLKRTLKIYSMIPWDSPLKIQYKWITKSITSGLISFTSRTVTHVIILHEILYLFQDIYLFFLIINFAHYSLIYWKINENDTI